MADDLPLGDMESAYSTMVGARVPPTGVNPAKAAEAVNLSNMTGVPAPVIHQDLDGFKARANTQAATQLIGSNPQLGQYLSSDPMHGQVSANDLGTLDEFSQKASSYSKEGLLQKVARVFREGDASHVVSDEEFQRVADYFDHPLWKSFVNNDLKPAVQTLTQAANLPGQVIAGGIAGVSWLAGAAGMDEYKVEKELSGIAESMPGEGGLLHQAEMRSSYNAMGKAMLSGKLTGVSPILDQALKAQSEESIAKLKEAFSLAYSSETRELAPEFFKEFAQQDGHFEHSTVGVSPEGIDILYPNGAIPEEGDGKLGNIPGMVEQIELARSAGSDVHVPIAEMAEHMDPENFKLIEDQLRDQPGGFTGAEDPEEIAASKGMPTKKQLEEAARNYGGGHAISANVLLRQGLEALVEKEGFMSKRYPAQVQKTIDAMDQMAKPLESDATLYRSMPIDPNLNPGDVVHDPGFMSTATSSGTPSWIAQDRGEHLVTITAPKGSPVVDLNKTWGAGERNEVVLPRGSRLQLTSVDHANKRAEAVLLPREEVAASKGITGQGKPNYPQRQVNEVYGYTGLRAAEHTDRGPVPEWLPSLQSVVDGLAKDLGLPITPKVWVGETTSNTEGYASSSGHIVVRSDIPVRRVVNIILHEFGHQVDFQRFRGLDDEDKQQIRDAWRREYGKEKTIDQIKPITSAPYEAGIPIDKVPSDHQIYLRSFQEWFAEQAQRWITKTEEPKNFVDKFFRGSADAWKAIYAKITGHMEVTPEIDKFMRGIWEGEPLGAGPIVDPLPKTPLEEILNRPEEIRVFHGPESIEMTKDHWKRYQALIEKQNDAEYKARYDRALKEEKKRLAPEWAQKIQDMRKQVVESFAGMPRFIADKGFQDGEFKFMSSALTDGQKAVLPKSYYGKDGKLPDNIAHLTGHSSGDALLQDLMDLHKNRNGMQPVEYTRKLIDQETNRRMEETHGRFADVAAELAKERTIKPSQLELMASEIEAMAKEYKFDLPIMRTELAAAIRDKFSKTPIGQISSENFLKSINRIDKRIEDALLKGNAKVAFQERQRKYIASMMADQALDLEKAQKNMEKIAKRFEDREVKNIRQQYTDQIHGILQQLDFKVKRTLADIRENMGKAGFDGLADFIEQKLEDERVIELPEFLTDPDWKKSYKEMTVDEFGQVHDLVKSLVANGRDEMKVYSRPRVEGGGEVYELADVLGGMKAVLKTLRDEPLPYQTEADKNTLGQKFKAFGWSLINIETICKRFDRGDPNGFFTKFFARPAIEAANYRDVLVREIAEDLKKIGDFKDLHKTVDNTIFRRPDIKNGDFLPTTRNHVISVLGHMGNADNWARLTEGWKVDPEVVKEWVFKNTTKDDWDKMQQIGHVFDKLFDLADRMNYDLNEIGIRRLKLGVVDERLAKLGYTGWYDPVAYEKNALKTPKVGKNAMPLEVTATGVKDHGMERFFSTTNQNYTKERTGFRGPVLLDTFTIPLRMQQMAHDIAMRPAVIQMNKFVNDTDLMAHIRNYYSPLAADMFPRFVKDLAGASDADPATLGKANDLLGLFLRNTAAAEIGFNIGTIMKHGPTALAFSALQVGARPFANAFFKQWSESPTKGMSWKEFAMNKSEELRRRSRLTPEDLAAQQGLSFPGANNTKWGKAAEAAETARNWGTAGVAYSDLVSAVPTWIAEYTKHLDGSMTEADAIARADNAVREAHGSSALSNKPELMRKKDPLARSMATFYSFFNERLNKVFEMGWRCEEAWGLTAKGDTKAFHEIGRAANIMASMMLAGLIEETVSGEGDPSEGWMSRMVKGTAHAFGATLPLVREGVQGVLTGHEPQGGLFAAGLKSFTDVAKDVSEKKTWTQPFSKQFIKHFAMLVSVMSGIPVMHPTVGLQFLEGVHHNTEHPTNVVDFGRGLAHGTVQHRR